MMKKLVLATTLAALCAAPVAAAPPTVTLKASAAAISYGAATTLSGALSTQKTGQSVDIQAQECGQNAFRRIASVTTTTGGAFTYTAKPALDTNYQAKQKGATSPVVSIKVSPQLRLVKLSSSSSKRRFAASVTASQSFAGKYVVFQKRGSTKWLTVKKVALSSAAVTSTPTQVTSQSFSARIRRHPKVRVILPADQAGACYLPAASTAIRS
jgi:hypothetical protein